MARDLELLEEVRTGKTTAVMRTYTWSPWTVSLGKNQADTVLDHDAISDRGYDVVRRPTGGRAVFHAEELTYCIAVSGVPPKEVYRSVHSFLQACLDKLIPGVLDFQSVTPDLRTHYASSGAMGQACFSSSARTEIMSGGRKVVGSAQRVMDGVVLQHGSILIGRAHLELADLLKMSEEARPDLREALGKASVSLGELTAETITVDSIRKSMGEVFVPFQLQELSNRETT